MGHRRQIQSVTAVLEKHFLEQHGKGFDLMNEELFEEIVMKHFSLTVITSVKPGKPWYQTNPMMMDYKYGLNAPGHAHFERKDQKIPEN